jgi:hypothetical protein
MHIIHGGKGPFHKPSAHATSATRLQTGSKRTTLYYTTSQPSPHTIQGMVVTPLPLTYASPKDRQPSQSCHSQLIMIRYPTIVPSPLLYHYPRLWYQLLHINVGTRQIGGSSIPKSMLQKWTFHSSRDPMIPSVPSPPSHNSSNR